MSEKEFIVVHTPERAQIVPVNERVNLTVTEPSRVEAIEFKLIRGPAGESWKPLSFEQPVPMDEWIINHNLGYFPNVTVFDMSGAEVECQKINVSINQLILEFNDDFAGVARLV